MSLPLICSQRPSRFTSTPRRSASGSLARITEIPLRSASWIVTSKAASSSGLGRGAVGKVPSGTAWASQTSRGSPARRKSSGVKAIPVPWKGV
jgi:hypothetical protein